MFGQSLKNNICMMIDTYAICWNVKNVTFGMMNLHPLPKFFADVNTLAIKEPNHILHC